MSEPKSQKSARDDRGVALARRFANRIYVRMGKENKGLRGIKEEGRSRVGRKGGKRTMSAGPACQWPFPLALAASCRDTNSILDFVTHLRTNIISRMNMIPIVGNRKR